MGFARLLGHAAMAPFSKALPPMGDTVRAALEAGTVGFEGRIFAGRPDFDALNKLVRRTLSFEEAAQGMPNPELALAYLRAADRVIQVDDFPP